MSDDAPTFEKQRRNVTIISIILLFCYLGNVEVGDTVKISILDAKVRNPVAIYGFMYSMLFYFLWRYAIAFRNIRAWDDYYEGIRNSMRDLAFERAYKILEPKGIKREKISSANVNGNWPESIDKTTNDIIQKGAIYYFEYSTPREPDSDSYDRVKLETPVKVKEDDIRKIKRKQLISHFIFTNLFLEYYLPLLLAVFAAATIYFI